MTRRRLGRVPVWLWVVLGWCGAAVLVAVVWVRVMRRRPEAPTPQLDDPLFRGTDLERLGTALDLLEAPNVHAARFYADRLIAYGMPHTVVDQALQQWHAEHRADFLFRDNSTTDDTEDDL